MPDIRYHFVYLIAVFLMLGVGMLVGASFVGPDQIKRQTTYISDLRTQTNQAIQEVQASEDQLAKIEQALEDLRPSLVRGTLAGRRVTLIQTGDYAEAMQDAATALRDAGASPVVTVFLSDRWPLLTASQQATALAGLSEALSEGTGAPANARALQSLQDQDLITITGDLAAPCSRFVLVGGAKDDGGLQPAGALDRALIAQLQSASSGAVIVGCEPFDAVVSFIPDYQQAQIATVDCIDRPLGQLDLPFALRGGSNTDDYGLKSTAKRLIPASVAPQGSE